MARSSAFAEPGATPSIDPEGVMSGDRHHVAIMRSDTRTVTIYGTAGQVFDFIADPQNLPRWAVGFCRAVRRDGEVPDRWIVTTAQGDLPIRYVTDSALGVI